MLREKGTAMPRALIIFAGFVLVCLILNPIIGNHPPRVFLGVYGRY